MATESLRTPHSIALVANTDWNLYHYRSHLIRTLVARDWQVYGVAPRGPYVERLEEMGVTFHHWAVGRRTGDPMSVGLETLGLARILRRLHPELVHAFTFKPTLLAPPATKLAGSPPVLGTFTGLGSLFATRSFPVRVVRRSLRPWFRWFLGLSSAVTFQNSDDAKLLTKIGVIEADKANVIPGGSGLDTNYFSPESVSRNALLALRTELGLPEDVPVVTLVSRMLWSKGIADFVAIARIMRRTRGARFLLVGPVDLGNADAIAQAQLDAWHAEGAIQYIGRRTDVREILALTDIAVLPTSYREGVPRVLLEASSMGKPIITTDAPGCRDVVDDGVNGYLIEPSDLATLTDRVGFLLDRPEMRTQFGAESRKRALANFGQEHVTGAYIELYERLIREHPVRR